jgi:hypothetical protein
MRMRSAVRVKLPEAVAQLLCFAAECAAQCCQLQCLKPQRSGCWVNALGVIDAYHGLGAVQTGLVWGLSKLHV